MSPKPFHAAARAAFPFGSRAMADEAARALASTVDDTYRRRSVRMEVLGESIYVPERLHFAGLDAYDAPLGGLPVAALCLVTRATDGHLRQLALRSILGPQTPWSMPFIALMAGDYVVEIVEEIRTALSTLDREVCSSFVRENRPVMRTLRSKAVSHWNNHYRAAYPERRDYPGVAILTQFEEWAS